MSKLEITIGKGNGAMTATAAKALMKADVAATIIEALNAKYGEGAAEELLILGASEVPQALIDAGDYPEKLPAAKLEIGVKCANISEDGGVYDGIQTIKLTSKEWEDRVGATTTKAAFNWDYAAGAARELRRREAEKAAAKAEKARKNAEEAAAKKAERERLKAEREARKAAIVQTTNETAKPAEDTTE